jgi:hypothetical protein
MFFGFALWAVLMGERLFVLIVATDPRLERQALCAVRAAGCHPMLGHDDEDCPAALRRTRPDVVLLDTLHPCAVDPAFFDEASAMGARVIALASDARDDDARALARRQNAYCVTLPTGYDLVSNTLRQAELG